MKTVAEQRTALAASLTTALAAAGIEAIVHPAPFSDPVPPCVMIGYPVYEVTVAKVGTASWPISVIVPRTTAEQITSDFDVIVPRLLLALAEGAGVQFTVQSAAPRLSTPEFPVNLPEYVIAGSTPISLC